MRNASIGAISFAIGLAFTGMAMAQQGTVTGAAGGAATGAIVGGPVGAAVGGVAGAALGTVLAPPPAEVKELVVKEKGTSVTIDGDIVVGKPLPETVVLTPVPGHTQYTYAVVNDRHVIVDPKTRVVIETVN